MNFDQSWMTELLELEKKATELVKGKNSADDVQGLVKEVLNKWGINNLPWGGDMESKIWAKSTPEQQSGPNLNIDISETKNKVLIQASIPGIEDKNDLLIKLKGDTLVISGKSNPPNNDDDGTFSRKIRLPVEVTALGAEATYRNDNLTISLPKTASEDGEIIPLNFPENN